MKTARLSALAEVLKAAATLKYQAWACRASLVFLAGTFILCAIPRTTFGNLFTIDKFNGRIGEYTNSGATINASLISGLTFPGSIAVSDGFIYVPDRLNGTISKYSTSGAIIDASFISGLNDPVEIEVSGGDLYVAEFGIARVGKYTTSGATINASLIPGLLFPTALAVSGTNLFVGDGGNGTVGEYTTSGATVNASLVTDLDAIRDVEVSGSSLFVSYYIGDDGTVGNYNVDGTVVDPMVICCQNFAGGLAVSGTDLYFVGDEGLGKYTTSGMAVAVPLITEAASAVEVDGATTVPETLSTLWFGLAIAGLLAFARFLRVHHGALISRLERG